MAQFTTSNLIAKSILPLYNSIAQKSKQEIDPEQMARWNEYVKSVLNPPRAPTRLDQYINGQPVQNPNPSTIYPALMSGVRS